MAWLPQKSAVLLAVYSIALQAVLGGFLSAHRFGIDPFAIICSTDGSGQHKPAPLQHRNECTACLLGCGSSPVLLPSSVTFSPLSFAVAAERPALLVEVAPVPSRHRPQESRAPPLLLS